MKFSLFVHMERTDTSVSHRELYAQVLELCDMADRGGMHAIWTGEHHAMDFTIAPNPFMNLVDLARRTKHVRLGTGTIVAPFWHPIKLAGEAAMADIIMEGRLDIGIARGAYSFEYERLSPGLDAWTAGQRLREIVPAIKGLWAGDYAHEGPSWSFPATTSSPKPLQEPHPPIWVAARDPNSHEFAVQNDCNVQVFPLHKGDEEVVVLMDKFEDACAKFPDKPRPKILLLRHTYVATDEDDAMLSAREHSAWFSYFGAWWKNERPIRQAFIEPLTDAEIAANLAYAPEEMRKNLTIGSAREVIARLRTFAAMGFDEYAYYIDCGAPFARKKAALERFIRDVMPAFR